MGSRASLNRRVRLYVYAAIACLGAIPGNGLCLAIQRPRFSDSCVCIFAAPETLLKRIVGVHFRATLSEGAKA